MSNLWSITSYEDYLNNWPSIANKFDHLTNYQESMGYIDPKDFFDKNAFAAQEIANDRVGGIIGRLFDTSDLPLPVKENLKKFTYRAMDHLRMNDLEVAQIDRQISTSYNNGRTDSTQIPGYSNLESVLGMSAWRAWTNSKIDKLYVSYAKEENIDFLLDPNTFYNKTQIDEIFLKLDDSIQYEHAYTNFRTDKLDEEVSLRAKILDQKLLVQEIDENDDPINSPKDLGYFDELLILSKRTDSTIVDTSDNKKRAVINLNESFGEITEAQIYQSSSETDDKNALGRIWAYGQENVNNQLKNEDTRLNDKIDARNFVGEIRYTKQGNTFLPGWIKNDLYGNEANYFKENINLEQLQEEWLIPNISVFRNQSLILMGVQSIWKKVENWKGLLFTKESSGNIENYSGWIFEYSNGSETFGATFEWVKEDKLDILTQEVWINGNVEDKTIVEKPFSAWEYVGVDENGNTISRSTKSFTLPHFEREQKEKEARVAKARELASLATKADLEPIKIEIQDIKPTVEELAAKEQFRIKKLGIDPNNKYWEEEDE